MVLCNLIIRGTLNLVVSNCSQDAVRIRLQGHPLKKQYYNDNEYTHYLYLHLPSCREFCPSDIYIHNFPHRFHHNYMYVDSSLFFLIEKYASVRYFILSVSQLYVIRQIE